MKILRTLVKMGLFGRDNRTPRDKVRDWISKLRKESMLIDRQIRGIQREETKTRSAIKEAGKRKDEASCRMLAKELVRSKRTITRLITSKAKINSVILSMTAQLADLKITGNLEKSSEIMKHMQSLMSIPEVASNMADLSKEMSKAGLIEEMVNDIIMSDQMDEEGEDEIQKEIDKILFETTEGKMGAKPETEVNGNKVKLSKDESSKIRSVEEPEATDEEAEIEAMEKRLEALRS